MKIIANKYVDVTSIIQVIGNVYNNPNILDFDDKYIITDNDFPDEFHRIIFGAIYKIHELGASKITLETVSDFLSSRPKSEAIYKQQKGEEWLSRASEAALYDSFDYYYGHLKKMSLLRAYNNYGIDVTDIYDPDNILDTKKRQRQEEFLDNSSLEDIANKVDKKIETIKLDYVDDAYSNTAQAGHDILNLIDKFKEHPEVGVPLYGPLINTVTRGARLKKFYLRSAASGTGKALPNDQIIPTPSGFRQVGEIKVGDYLFGDDGVPTKVKQVHPQKGKKRRFTLILSDGREIDCCRDHLWEFITENNEIKVENTEKVRERLRNKETLKIKVNQPVQWRHSQTKYTHYVLGLLYANAILNVPTPGDALAYRCKDEEVIERIKQVTGWTARKTSALTWIFFDENYDFIKNSDIFDKGKIPKEYLINDIKSREALLRGYLDGCGLVSSFGEVGMVFPAEEIKQSISTLCYSLGYYLEELPITAHDKIINEIELNVYKIHCPLKKKVRLFNNLEKSKKLMAGLAKYPEQKEFNEYLEIKKVREERGKATYMTCFTVDNKSHLFLAKDFIVTHNTRSMIADACYISCGWIYDESFGWIKTGYKQPTLFISTEQELEEIQTMMLAFLSNVNEEHILNGRYEGDEEIRVTRAAEILQEAPLYIELLPDFSLQDIENTIKRNIHEHDVLYIAMDYIHSSIKILSEIGSKAGVKLREDNILFMLSTRLKDLCNKYGIFIISATQLNSSYQESETPDQNLLRGAKSIADCIWNMINMNLTQSSLMETLSDYQTENCWEIPLGQSAAEPHLRKVQRLSGCAEYT